MTGKTDRNSGGRFAARLGAMAFGAALLALPGTVLAQQDDHHDGHGGGNGGQHEQPAARPTSAPAQARPAPVRGDMGRGPGQWGGQDRAGIGNGGQARAVPSNPAAGQYRPAFQGQPGQQGGNNAGRYDGGRGRDANYAGATAGNPGRNGDWRNNDNRGGNDRGNGWQGRNEDGRVRNDGARYNGGRYDGGPGRGQPGYGQPGFNRGGGQWNHNWRQDNRYDWRGWREQNRDAFHVGRYYAPYRGYSYNRLGIGFYLQPLFFGSDYFINDPYYYRLPPAYGPYRWVRYYNDAVLVNTYDGQVADVIYDFFW